MGVNDRALPLNAALSKTSKGSEGMMRSAIEAANLVRRYERVRAIDSVDMSLLLRDAGLHVDGDEENRSSSESIAWAIGALRDQDMPSEEIATVLGADDPELVRRYFELHQERLEEHLADQRRTLARLERLLAARSMSAARQQKIGASGE